jgi:hypothetical protein
MNTTQDAQYVFLHLCLNPRAHSLNNADSQLSDAYGAEASKIPRLKGQNKPTPSGRNQNEPKNSAQNNCGSRTSNLGFEAAIIDTLCWLPAMSSGRSPNNVEGSSRAGQTEQDMSAISLLSGATVCNSPAMIRLQLDSRCNNKMAKMAIHLFPLLSKEALKV